MIIINKNFVPGSSSTEILKSKVVLKLRFSAFSCASIHELKKSSWGNINHIKVGSNLNFMEEKYDNWVYIYSIVDFFDISQTFPVFNLNFPDIFGPSIELRC